MTKLRARQLGLKFPGVTGKYNAITDVSGVLVGYRTIDAVSHDDKLIKTGVTALLPRGYQTEPQPVWAGCCALNGNGEMTGAHWIKDGGYFVGPVCLTNTHSVGTVHQAAVKWMLSQYQAAWQANHLWAMPVVAETYDGVINDINGLHVTQDDALSALTSARDGALAEGNVGGGNGMICYGFKGGTGTSSRCFTLDGRQYTLGALVQANYGQREWFELLGVPVGALLTDPLPAGLERERGSIIVVLATDAPMMPHQLQRLARRAGLGIAKSGSPGGNNSGDIFLAFSTANAGALPQLAQTHRAFQYLNDEVFDTIYQAAVDSTHEAVINAMLAAEDAPMQKPQGICRAIDPQALYQLVKRRNPAALLS
ncbi:P1 family peptidase [Affinibrenneria salicis]|uniref:P1 family peptidase n=2 Tax=Affinibrenneria salicis TaxID=2590031 RepID=A0A5J5G858_9GAMM|nr:P1 family peptidase [Affinibrenneria salicis]KAA9003336.1 P1 family peptidase [Affinibrenneria salicis]